KLPPATRRSLQKVRETIQSAAPSATEVVSYGIPAFRFNGRILVYYAAWKNHYSIYPMTDAIRRAHAAELQGYETSKGTVRVPLTKRVPTRLIKRLVKARMAAISSPREAVGLPRRRTRDLSDRSAASAT